MNYITTNHRGGLGNVMFKLATSISMGRWRTDSFILICRRMCRGGIKTYGF
jgi:hypothetical protein